jgi:hypothetical protein
MGLTNPIIPDARAAKEGDVTRAGRRHSATSLAIDQSGVIAAHRRLLTGLDGTSARAIPNPERTAEPRSNARLIAQNDELNDFIAAE